MQQTCEAGPEQVMFVTFSQLWNWYRLDRSLLAGFESTISPLCVVLGPSCPIIDGSDSGLNPSVLGSPWVPVPACKVMVPGGTFTGRVGVMMVWSKVRSLTRTPFSVLHFPLFLHQSKYLCSCLGPYMHSAAYKCYVYPRVNEIISVQKATALFLW